MEQTFRAVASSASRGLLKPVWLALLAFVFPDACVACGSALGGAEQHLCADCRARVRLSPGSIALPSPPVRTRNPGGAPDRPRLSGRPSVGVPVRRGSGEAGVTGVAHYALVFEPPVREFVHALKYGGRTSIAAELADAVRPVVALSAGTVPDVVVPVPLHPVRRRERGFNQSELIARELGRLLDAPMDLLLRRARHGPPQASLGRSGRLEAPWGAFEAAGTVPRSVLLLDDVVTTGSTLAAAAAALRAAGAEEVVCLAVAGVPSAPPTRNGLTGKIVQTKIRSSGLHARPSDWKRRTREDE